MLAVRGEHHAFGRGTLRFLYPGNRKILAYLRELEERWSGETILCVGNLSRTAQAVELDLSALHAAACRSSSSAARPFPPIGQLTYLLTLPPYGFYWFLLATEAQLPPGTRRRRSRCRNSRPSCCAASSPRCSPSAEPRHRSSARSLPAYLPKRRWFAAKGETLHGVRIAYAVPLPGSSAILLLAEIEADRRRSHASATSCRSASAGKTRRPARWRSQLALARVRRGRASASSPTPSRSTRFACVLARRACATRAAVRARRRGEIRFLPTSRLAELEIAGDARDPPAVRRAVEQLADRRRRAGDEDRAPRRRRHPSRRRDDAATSPSAASATRRRCSARWCASTPTARRTRWRSCRASCATRATAGAGRSISSRAAWTSSRSPGSAATRRGGEGGHLRRIRRLRRRDRPAARRAARGAGAADRRAGFRARAGATTRCSRNGRDGAIEQLDGAFALLRPGPRMAGRDGARTRGAALLGARGRAAARRSAALPRAARAALRTRVHGDFHLGQVLVVAATPISSTSRASRRARWRSAAPSPRGCATSPACCAPSTMPRPPRRAATAASSPRQRAAHGAARAVPRRGGRHASSTRYRAVLDAAEQRWVTPEAEPALLDLFLLEKAAYEIRYEAANRPTWLGDPAARACADIADACCSAPETQHG